MTSWEGEKMVRTMMKKDGKMRKRDNKKGTHGRKMGKKEGDKEMEEVRTRLRKWREVVRRREV